MDNKPDTGHPYDQSDLDDSPAKPELASQIAEYEKSNYLLGFEAGKKAMAQELAEQKEYGMLQHKNALYCEHQWGEMIRKDGETRTQFENKLKAMADLMLTKEEAEEVVEWFRGRFKDNQAIIDSIYAKLTAIIAGEKK